MKKIIGILTIIGLSGCASWVPKEDYRQMVLDTLEGKQRNTQKIDVRKRYELYSGGTWSGRQIQRNMGYVKDFADACEGGIASIKKLSEKPMSPKFNISDLEDDYTSINNEFISSCTVGYDLRNTVAKSVSINFVNYQGEYQSRFNQYARPVEDKIAMRKEADSKKHKKKMAENERYKKSSAYMSEKMCEGVAIIAQAKRRIQQENNAAKHSGYVDKNVMHRNGQRISIFTKRLDTAKKDYKKKFGKSWSSKACD